jgi:DNA-directed RNA polymerase subunit D
MKAEIITNEGNKIQILLKDAKTSEVNALRRTILSDVPKMAISRVRFEMGLIEDNGESYESINVLPDEVIAHRLAMLPIPTYYDRFCFPEEDPANEGLPEDQWGSPASQIIYHCSVRGPSKDSEEEFIVVRAGDLNVLGEVDLQIPEQYKGIPLTTVIRGQYLEFYAYAVIGRGSEHAKFIPASGVAFYQREVARLMTKGKKSKVLFDLDLTTEDGRAIDAKLFGKDGVIDDIDMVEEIRRALAHVSRGTNRDTDFGDAIVLEKVAGEFVFTYETDGALRPEEVFNRACEELSARFVRISDELDTALA